MPKKFDREPVAWITRGGKHIPIFEDEESKLTKEQTEFSKSVANKYRRLIEANPEKIDQLVNDARGTIGSRILSRNFGESIEDFYKRKPVYKLEADEIKKMIEEMGRKYKR